jgi:hypothetical protein
MIKMSQMNPKLREKVQRQIAEEDRQRKAGGIVPGLRSAKPKQAVTAALEPGQRQSKEGQKGFRHRVVVVALRRRLLDAHDNAKSACKALCDIIAESLEVDDREIEWQIEQLKTSGRPGTLVMIESL